MKNKKKKTEKAKVEMTKNLIRAAKGSINIDNIVGANNLNNLFGGSATSIQVT